mmetsp:Transcript_13863/g.27645  ORF Transcript_13863/g.27645 Transcript_13863/m.27645 type:complete len:178 (+) Transcript_13863:1842-2375(+)
MLSFFLSFFVSLSLSLSLSLSRPRVSPLLYINYLTQATPPASPKNLSRARGRWLNEDLRESVRLAVVMPSIVLSFPSPPFFVKAHAGRQTRETSTSTTPNSRNRFDGRVDSQASGGERRRKYTGENGTDTQSRMESLFKQERSNFIYSHAQIDLHSRTMHINSHSHFHSHTLTCTHA